jgi:hypothetical protein
MRAQPSDILIVDDDSEVSLAAELVLKKPFQNVVTASDPARIRIKRSFGRIDQRLPARARTYVDVTGNRGTVFTLTFQGHAGGFGGIG